MFCSIEVIMEKAKAAKIPYFGRQGVAEWLWVFSWLKALLIMLAFSVNYR